MVKSSKKGGAFERRIAVEMSEWWSLGQSDDLFWRTPGSGARATARTKKGKTTSTGSGDLLACDARGKALLDLCTFELKKGYSKTTLQDLFDIPESRPGMSEIDKFVAAAHRASQESGSTTWALITERDRRLSLITFPLEAVGLKMFRSNDVKTMITHNRTSETVAPILITASWEEFICSISPNDFVEGIRNSQRRGERRG
jgi:hypothetical protein